MSLISAKVIKWLLKSVDRPGIYPIFSHILVISIYFFDI